MAEDQRQHEGEHGRGEHGEARQVELALRAVGVRRWQQPAECQDREADWHVDQEDRPPRGAEQIGADEQPADHLAKDGTA
jgi:hypothetical protein